MPDPIRVSVVFDAQGQIHLQKGAESLKLITNRIIDFISRAKDVGRVTRMMENDLNRFASVLHTRVGGALNFFNSQFERMHSLVNRFARFGFYAMVGQVTALSFAFARLAKEFLNVNERFQGLEIVMKSVYGSARTARMIRDEIAKITITSPLTFQNISNVVRAYSAMPALSSQIGRQAIAGTTGQQDSFLRKAVEVVEQMTTFRPDKLAEDAVFAIREAVSGELRSLIRRFEFPSSLLVQASGRSIQDLKRDPMGMFNALKKSMDSIISPAAVREMARIPSKLFQNIMEQIFEIPLLLVGRAGEDAGRSFYETFLKYFSNVLKMQGEFISSRFPAIATNMGASLLKLFSHGIKAYTSVSEGALSKLGFGVLDLPGRGQLERVYKGFEKLLDVLSTELPSAVETITAVFEQLTPVFNAFVGAVRTLVSALAFVSEKAGGWGLLGAGLAWHVAPSLVGTGLGAAKQAGIGGAVSIRGSYLAGIAETQIAGQKVAIASAIAAQNASNMSAAAALNTGLLSRYGLRGVGGRITSAAAAGVSPWAALPSTLHPSTIATLQSAGWQAPTAAAGAATLTAAQRTAAIASVPASTWTAGIKALLPIILSAGFLTVLIAEVTAILYTASSLGKVVAATERSNAIALMTVQRKVPGFLTSLGGHGSAFADIEAAVGNKAVPSDVRVQLLKQMGMTGSLPMLDYGAGGTQTGLFRESGSGSMSLERGLALESAIMRDIAKLQDSKLAPSDITLESNTARLTTESDRTRLAKDLETQLPLIARRLDDWIAPFTAIWDAIENAPQLTSEQSQLYATMGDKLKDITSAQGVIGNIGSLSKIMEEWINYSKSNFTREITKAEDTLRAVELEGNPFAEVNEAIAAEHTRIVNVRRLYERYVNSIEEAVASGLDAQAATEIDAYINLLESAPGPKRRSVVKLIEDTRQALRDVATGGKNIRSFVESGAAQIRGGLNLDLGSMLGSFMSTFTNVMQHQDFAAMSPFQRRRFSENLPTYTGAVGAQLGQRTDTYSNTLSYLSGMGPMFGAAAPNLDVNDPTRAGGLNIAGAQFKLSYWQGFRSALLKDQESVMTYDEMADLDKSIEDVTKLVKTWTERLNDVVGSVENALLQEIQRLNEDVLGRIGSYTPVMGAAGRAMLGTDMGKYSGVMRGRSMSGGNLSYLGMPGLGFEQNQRMQRIFAQGQAGRLRSLGSGYLSQASAETNNFSDTSAGMAAYDRYTKLAEQARIAFEQAAAAEEKFAIRNFDVQQTFTAGWQATFDNFKENAWNFMDIGTQMATSLTEGLGTAFAEMTTGAKSAGEAFQQMGYQFLMTASKMLSNRLFEMLLGAIMPAASTGGNPVKNVNTQVGVAGTIIRAVTGVGFADGGLIGRDNALIAASTGEYVIPRSAVNRYGASHFDAYRNGGVPTLPVNSAVVPVNIVVNIDNKGGASVDSKSAQQDADMMSRGLRIAIQEELLRQGRQGGYFKGRG